MKLKDFMSAVVHNQNNGQFNASFKKSELKQQDISIDELLEMQVMKKTKLDKLY